MAKPRFRAVSTPPPLGQALIFNMKIVKATNIGIAAAIVPFSTGCSQIQEKELNAELASTQSALSKTQAELADARKAREEAEDQLSKAKAQAEIASQTEPKTDAGKPSGKPSSKKERFSYAVGMQIGGDFGSKELEIDFDHFAKGVQTAYLSRERLMDEKEAKEILDEVWKDYQERERAKRSAASEATKKESMEYLAANLKKPGVKPTASGLQYRVLKPCLLYTSPSPRDATLSRMPSSA